MSQRIIKGHRTEGFGIGCLAVLGDFGFLSTTRVEANVTKGGSSSPRGVSPKSHALLATSTISNDFHHTCVCVCVCVCV